MTSSLLQQIRQWEACLVFCMSECNKISSLLQRIRQWEACLVDCLSECNKISSLLQQIRQWEACLVDCLSECNMTSSLLQRIGLWEACFAGLVLENDPSTKAYHGCWWVLAPEFYSIRGWLLPGKLSNTLFFTLSVNFISFGNLSFFLFFNCVITGKQSSSCSN